MPFGIPISPGEILKATATDKIVEALNRAQVAADAGDNIGAAQGFFQATAVSAAYVAGIAYGFTKYPISGLDSALRNLANSPGIYESSLAVLLRNMGLATDPLVISRLATVAKPFAGGAAAAYFWTVLGFPMPPFGGPPAVHHSGGMHQLFS